MGITVILHGYIDSPFDFGRTDESRRIFEHNRSVIMSLPLAVDEHPFIDRSMFPVHPPKGIVPYYGSSLITFGGAYKNMYQFESDWIGAFDQLLAQLCWGEASAFLDFRALRADWKAERAYERAFADQPLPPLKWSVTYSQLSRREISCARRRSPTSTRDNLRSRLSALRADASLQLIESGRGCRCRAVKSNDRRHDPKR